MSTEKKYNLESMTRTSLLARNTMYNLLGQAAPFVAILIALPLLTQRGSVCVAPPIRSWLIGAWLLRSQILFCHKAVTIIEIGIPRY